MDNRRRRLHGAAAVDLVRFIRAGRPAPPRPGGVPTALLALLLCGVLAAPAQAAPGDLDAGFGDAGLVTENVGTTDGRFRAEAVVQQADGKLVVGGSTESDAQFVIARYDTDGSLDTTFGGGDGVAILTVGRYLSNLQDLALQSDGKIVAVGSAYRDFGVLRLDPDGSVDTGFGTDGVVTTDFASDVDTANAVVIAGDGDIIVGGKARSGTYDFALARYQSDGSLDSTFSGDGKLTTDFPAGFNDEILGLALQADGKIVAAGEGSGDFGLARYTATGTLDTGFDTDGLVTTDFGGADEVGDVAIAATGEITAAGKGDGDLALARYESNGSLDTSFDADGKVTTSQDGVGGATGLVLSGGKAVVSASAGPGNFDYAIARFNADGGLDTDSDGDPGVDLGGDGVVTTDINGHDDFATDLIEQSDGKFVLAGVADSGTLSAAFGLVRYDTDGTLDNGFDANGIVTSTFTIPSDDAGFASARTPDGKLVIAGETNTGSDLDFLVMRFNADGSLDTSFDGDGIVVTDLGGADYARAVAVQPDGKILVGGRSNPGFNGDFAVVRYNQDGSLDTDSDADPGTDFGFDGTVTEDLGGSNDVIKSLAVQANGKIVAAGSGPDGFALARFDEFGDLDTSFDGDGILSTDFGGASNTSATGVVIAGDRIIAAGSAGGDFALARYNRSDGSLDTSFDGDGLVRTDFGGGSADGAESLALQADGKPVAAGWSNSGGASGVDFALARYNTDGSLDTSFDGDGLLTTTFSAGAEETALAVAVQSDGKILAGGYEGAPPNGVPRSFALARFDSGGGLDGGFGSGGKVSTDFGASSLANGLTLMPDGDAVLTGHSFDGPDDLALARYQSGGAAVPMRTLTVTTAGDGSGRVTGPGIDCPGDCVEQFAQGTAVSLNASAGGGSEFGGWSGACSGGGVCNVTLSADRQVSATFNAAPDNPDFGEPTEVDNVDAFDLELQPNKKGLIKGTVLASQAGRVIAKAVTRKKGKRYKYKTDKADVRPHRNTKLKLKPKRKTAKLLRKRKRPQKVAVTVKYKPDDGNQVYKQREKVKVKRGRTKAIARWVQVAVGTSSNYFLDSVRGVVVKGSVAYDQVSALTPVNAKVPGKLKVAARRACEKKARPLIELLLQSPDGTVYGGPAGTGDADRTKFTSPTDWENNVWPHTGKDSAQWSVLVRTGWPNRNGRLNSTRQVRTKFKGRKRTVFCNGTQGSFPQPFVPSG